MMKFRLAGTAQDSIVDGPGLRLTVFVQGCPHHCPGCHNPETHDFAGGREADTQEMLDALDKNPLLCGVTLSGGEPFCQCAAMAEIASGARARGKNVWAYSGFTYEELCEREDAKALLALCDVLVDGRFELERRSLALKFRGSANQRVIDLKKTRASGQVTLWQDPWDGLARHEKRAHGE